MFEIIVSYDIIIITSFLYNNEHTLLLLISQLHYSIFVLAYIFSLKIIQHPHGLTGQEKNSFKKSVHTDLY